MEIIKTMIYGENSIHNHIKFENGNYIHKQIEKTNGRVYMRLKQRRLIEVIHRNDEEKI